MASFQAWIAEHKLTTIGAFWASAIGASFAYNSKKTPLKPSLRLIHARMHAQALTLGVLSSAAMLHYYNNINYASADTGKLTASNSTETESSHFMPCEEEMSSWWL